MAENEAAAVMLRVMAERLQSTLTRSALYEQIEEMLGKPIVAYFTSFRYPASLEDADVNMLGGFLQMMDMSQGLALMISSGGGDGLAAERMIEVCRRYSGTGEYEVIVPGKAKSAATMVCFGASKIYMGPTSELGPVDPQVTIVDGGLLRRISAFHIVQSYETLFHDAIVETGNLEPYLQQLARYDASIISAHQSDIRLSRDISIGALKAGMMSELSEEDIERRIEVFLTPTEAKTHGRPIFPTRARDCGLNVQVIDAEQEVWQHIYELYIRLDHYVSEEVAKCIENKDGSFIASRPPLQHPSQYQPPEV